MVISFFKLWAIFYGLFLAYSLVFAIPIYSVATKYGENWAIAVYCAASAFVIGLVCRWAQWPTTKH